MIEKVELPFRFEGLHTPSLFGWDGSHDTPGFRSLVDDIATKLGRGRAVKPVARVRLGQKKQKRSEEDIKLKTSEQVNERRPSVGQTALKQSEDETKGAQRSDLVPKPVFAMPIEDIFSIAGRGTVVTGLVKNGTCQVGQEVAILKNGVQVRRCTVSGIEQFKKLIDTAKTGDQVGILLRGVAKEELEPGMVVVSPV
jgi:translation initiation factor IF-2